MHRTQRLQRPLVRRDGARGVVGAVEDVAEAVVGVGQHELVGLGFAVEQLDGVAVQVQRLVQPARGVEHLAELAQQRAALDGRARPAGLRAREPQRRREHLLGGGVQGPLGEAAGHGGQPVEQAERQAPQRLAVRRDLDEVGGGVPFVGVGGQADPGGGIEPGPRRRRAEPDAHHVLHEPVHPQDRPLAVDERKAQQLADGFLHVQLVAVGQRPQHLDGDRVGREERHRLQHPGGQRRAPPEPVEREAPGGGDGAQLGLAAAVEAHVVGHGHTGLLDVGAGLLQGQRQVAEQLGQLGGGRGVRIAAALDDVGDRLLAGERRHRDRAGQPSPGLVAGGDDDVAVHRGGQVGLQPRGLVGVVEHEHPARCPVQLGPQRGAGVLLARPRRGCPGPWRDRPGPRRCPRGPRRRPTTPRGPPAAAGARARTPARSCPLRACRTARPGGGCRRPARLRRRPPAPAARRTRAPVAAGSTAARGPPRSPRPATAGPAPPRGRGAAAGPGPRRAARPTPDGSARRR